MSKKQKEKKHTIEENNESTTTNPSEVTPKEVPKSTTLAEDYQNLGEQYKLLLADFDNHRKRTQMERSYWITQANNKLFVALLPIIDDFELAMQVFLERENLSEAEKGIVLIYKKLVSTLEEQNLQIMKVEQGEEFNPDHHEALSTLTTEEESLKGKIAEIISKGYMVKEKIIRFSKVIVYV